MATKHECDGHNRRIVEDDVRIGVVVRRPQNDKGMPAFSDMVIVGITYGEEYRRRYFNDLESAFKLYRSEMGLGMAVSHQDTAYRGIQIHLARPYLYADSVGSSLNHLTGVERFVVSARSLLDSFSVVEMSTGELATSNIREGL